MAKRKPPTISNLKKKLWKIFAEYIKAKDSVDGYCRCYTCRKTLTLGTIDCQAGHWLPKGSYDFLYFNEMNVKPQCSYCNLALMGNQEEFRRALVNEHGAEAIEEMYQSRRTLGGRRRDWYLEKIEEYTAKLKSL
jgi:hypothetical protein